MKTLFRFLLLAIMFDVQSSMVNDIHAQTVRDRYNSQVGKIESDGVIRDRYNSQIGKVERDGTVRDRYNSQIGKVDGIEPRIAAILFFMNLLQLY